MAYKYEINCEKYRLCADLEGGKIDVETKDGCLWQMLLKPYAIFSDDRRAYFPSPSDVCLKEAATSTDIYANYEGIGSTQTRFYTRISLERISGDLRFEIWAEGDKPGEIKYVAYPSAWDLGAEEGAYTVLPRMQGEMIPKGSDLNVTQAQIYERTAYMPIFGGVKRGGAYIAIYDTPFDASYDYASDKASPLWRPSLGALNYKRRIVYRFINGDYNDIAKSYRAYLKEKGRLVTLKAKAAINPKVDLLAGCPIIHTGITVHISPDSNCYRPNEPEYNDHFTSFDERAAQIRLLKKKGLKKAYTHFDGWGARGYDNLHPSPLPPSPIAGGAEGMRRLMDAVRECGYLFGIHDQYRDYYYDAPGFDIDEARQNLNGSHSHNHIWYGGHYAFLCAEKAVEYVRRNYLELRKMGIVPDSSYLDVFSLAELDECFNPRHKITREQSAMYRRECLDILTSMGIIPSSEEVLDCVLPSQALCHHAPFNADDLSSPSRAVGIPLLNLVYHDCVIVPWIGMPGENGSSGLPEPNSAYLYAILNANPVYCPIDADERSIKQVEAACAVSEHLMRAEMTRHEFLSKDRLKQKTAYSDGTEIFVDMEKGAFEVKKAQTV